LSRARAPNAIAGQYGDSCDAAARTTTHGSDRPGQQLSGSRPESRNADHLFVNIEKLHAFLDQWTQSGDHLQTEIANYLKGHFLGEPLHDWTYRARRPIRLRDSRQSGQLLVRLVRRADRLHRLDATVVPEARREARRLVAQPGNGDHHFIGKDITYFHTLFWPAMLQAAASACPARSTSTAS